MLQYRSASALANKVEIVYTYDTLEEALTANNEIKDIYKEYLKKNPTMGFETTIEEEDAGAKLKIIIVKDGNSKKIRKGR